MSSYRRAPEDRGGEEAGRREGSDREYYGGAYGSAGAYGGRREYGYGYSGRYDEDKYEGRRRGSEYERPFDRNFGRGVAEGYTFSERARYGRALDLRDGVESSCRRFTDETGVMVSRPARELITVILEAIIRDPHPRWTAPEDFRMAMVGRFVNDLPLILDEVRRRGGVTRGRITSFDLLHHLTFRLEEFCPFK